MYRTTKLLSFQHSSHFIKLQDVSNTTPTMGLQATRGPTNTKWTGKGCQDKRNGREVLEEKSTGSLAHPPTAAHLQL